MKCRCNNSNHPTYKYYGGRNIHICEEWNNSYSVFKTWAMTHGYNEDLEPERVDVNKGYDPQNCTWITHHEQTMNRRDTLYITIGNNTFKLKEFCANKGLNKNTIRGWRYLGVLEQKLENIFKQPVLITGGQQKGVIRNEDNT